MENMNWGWGGSRIGTGNPNWKGGKYFDKEGYVNIKFPSHPKADKQGYVKEHILIIEKALGKSLPVHSEPHHVNKAKGDNINSNLVLCENHAYHHLLHQRQQALDVSGHASWRKCRVCKFYDKPENLFITKDNHVYHKMCEISYQQKYRMGVGR